jgi:Amidohydrolase
MPHLDQSVGEMRRALDELRITGVAMNTTVLGRALVEPDYEPIFAELNRRGAVLYLHPVGNNACSLLIGNYHLTWMVGAPVEDTISIMHLITHGIPARYPNIKIINSLLGGALPMLLQRADDQYRWEAPDTPEPPSVAARRMWYDTVGHGHVPALRCAIDSFGAGRLLLGTDFPYENADTLVRAIDYINDPQIGTSTARAILDQKAGACSASDTNASEPPAPRKDEVNLPLIPPVCASTHPPRGPVLSRARRCCRASQGRNGDRHRAGMPARPLPPTRPPASLPARENLRTHRGDSIGDRFGRSDGLSRQSNWRCVHCA